MSVCDEGQAELSGHLRNRIDAPAYSELANRVSIPHRRQDVSIVIPTVGRPDLLRQTLEAIASQDVFPEEVIVVCDGPNESTRKLCEARVFPFRVSCTTLSVRQGCAAARNAGALRATGEVLIFLDDDTMPTTGWLSAHLLHHLKAEPANIVVFGRIQHFHLTEAGSRTEAFLRSEREEHHTEFAADLSTSAETFNASHSYATRSFGVNCSVRKNVFLGSGAYDPLLDSCSEEIDLGARLYSRGILFTFESRALTVHHDSKTLFEYHQRCWDLGARYDVSRVQRGQRNPQTRGLAAIAGYERARSLKARSCWHLPSVVRALAWGAQQVTELTNSRTAFGVWAAAKYSVTYWESVKKAGLSLNDLKSLTGLPARVLSFHSVSTCESATERKYHISPRQFNKVLNSLRERYRFISASSISDTAIAPNSISLTFDDGFDDFYIHVFPVVQQYQLKPLVYVVSDLIGKTNVWDAPLHVPLRRLLSLSHIRELHRHGVEIGCHTASHPWLPSLTGPQLRAEIADSKARLEDLLGSSITSFAYPFGGVDARVRAEVAQAGFKTAFSTKPGLNLWGDPLVLNRFEIAEIDNWLTLRKKLGT